MLKDESMADYQKRVFTDNLMNYVQTKVVTNRKRVQSKKLNLILDSQAPSRSKDIAEQDSQLEMQLDHMSRYIARLGANDPRAELRARIVAIIKSKKNHKLARNGTSYGRKIHLME